MFEHLEFPKRSFVMSCSNQWLICHLFIFLNRGEEKIIYGLFQGNRNWVYKHVLSPCMVEQRSKNDRQISKQYEIYLNKIQEI